MSEVGSKQKGEAKTARIPIKVVGSTQVLPKPPWIRVRLGNNERFHAVKQALRANGLHTVCEEASCPNIGECFGKGTAPFMILGDLCTRRCPFCDVALSLTHVPAPALPRARLGHAALFAFGTSVAAAVPLVVSVPPFAPVVVSTLLPVPPSEQAVPSPSRRPAIRIRWRLGLAFGRAVGTSASLPRPRLTGPFAS